MWRTKPFFYQINTRVWLTELSRQYGHPISLYTVPDEVLDALMSYRFDAVWLMGVWQRNPAGHQNALKYIHEYRHALPDITEADIIGSAYAIGAYEVDSAIGGREGLAALRARLAQRGMKLILDYVPNHAATDHAWVKHHPEYVVRGELRELRERPGMFFAAYDANNRKYAAAHGRDPFFPSWGDTVQLNAFHPAFRAVTCETLRDIATQCDGVRCDMAMLLMNDVFERTWGALVEEPKPATEFWEEVIPAVRAHFPQFLFIAEAYWGLEYALQQQGFDFTYDKTLYDHLLDTTPDKVLAHLEGHLDFQKQCLRFIENHDEPRAVSAFGIDKSKAAAILVTTVPGGVLIHDGQMQGRSVKLPVQISRQPDETPNETLTLFYRRLLAETHEPIYQRGEWMLLNVEDSAYIAYGWRHGDDFRLIVVNMTGKQVEGMVDLGVWGAGWMAESVLRGGHYDTTHTDTFNITLNAYDGHIFRLERIPVMSQ